MPVDDSLPRFTLPPMTASLYETANPSYGLCERRSNSESPNQVATIRTKRCDESNADAPPQ